MWGFSVIISSHGPKNVMTIQIFLTSVICLFHCLTSESVQEFIPWLLFQEKIK